MNINWVNHRLFGHVDDYSHNHGEDRRLYSPVLGRKRDLYVYTPPGYDPRRSYPMILWLHMAYVDEHVFLGSPALLELDRMIVTGEIPPVIVACPDLTYEGENKTSSIHSLAVNGRGGRFEDHLIGEVLPFVMSRYSVRPERQAHGIFGLSGGGFGGMSFGIRRRDLFGAVATLASPVNVRYDDIRPEGPRENFNPETYRWKARYDPDEVYGVWYFGLRKTRAAKYIDPLFGSGPEVNDILRSLNPADLLFTTNLQPGELFLYCHFRRPGQLELRRAGDVLRLAGGLSGDRRHPGVEPAGRAHDPLLQDPPGRRLPLPRPPPPAADRPLGAGARALSGRVTAPACGDATTVTRPCT